MSEPQAPYRAGSAPDATLDPVAAAVARFNAEDPHLVELLDRARRAFDELAAYMAAKCAAARVEVPK